MDLGYPIIEYPAELSSRAWGELHGEQYREAISELAQIRYGLLNNAYPDLDKDLIEEFARIQMESTKFYSPSLYEELRGIKRGADISLLDLVVLNNYTDFRDLLIPDQGCSTIAVKRDGRVLAGFTWDMHGSAQDYCAVLKIPQESEPEKHSYVLTVVGCVGMAGFGADKTMCSINNLNTLGAKPYVMWPVVVRSLLTKPSLDEMEALFMDTKIGSGRNYLLADRDSALMYEVAPGQKELVASLVAMKEIFHTNHAISKAVKEMEVSNKISITSHDRFKILSENAFGLENLSSLKTLLSSHEGLPKSICVHASNNQYDPSRTCAAACADLDSGEIFTWKGCDQVDCSVVSHKFQI